jgi:hypothetical protein
MQLFIVLAEGTQFSTIMNESLDQPFIASRPSILLNH